MSMEMVSTACFWLTACCLTAVLLKRSGALSDTGAPGAFFYESFGPGWNDRWHYTTLKKYQGVFETVQPESYQDTAIQIPEGNQHYGMSALLPEPLRPADGIIVQYEVQFAKGHTCGGAYLKLISQADEPFKTSKLKSKTPFSVMFGPDRCGPDSRVHVILNVRHPVTEDLVEHHLMSAPLPKDDELSHVYTLVLYSNHRYKVLIDGQDKGSGVLAAADFSPPLQPPEVLPDPDHIKPEDWVEEDTIDDPTAVKPQDWDDRRLIPDPNAQKPFGWLDAIPPRIPDPDASKPADWDDATDGEWLRPTIANPVCDGAPGCGPWNAPMIKNPAYKGPWIAPKIKNPDYKGPWQQRQIPNPAYFNAEAPLTLIAPIVAVAFELWVTEPGYIFDSILIGKGEEGLDAAAAYMRQTWRPRFQKQYAAAMAAARAADRPPGLRHVASNFILDVFEAQLLRSLKPSLAPALQGLQQNPELAWVLAAAPVLLLALAVLGATLRARARKVNSPEFQAAVAAEQAAEAEHRAMQEELRQQRQAAKRAAAAREAKALAADTFAAAPATTTAGRDALTKPSSPAEASASRPQRRGRKQQQQQEEEEEELAAAAAGGDAEPQSPAELLRQDAGSPESDSSGGRRTRVTRQSARKPRM